MRAKMLPLMLGALIATGTAYAPAALAKDDAPPQPTISKELGAPIKAAQDALGQKNYQAALDALNQAEAAKAERTPYEDYIITEMRVVAYANLHDDANTATQIEKELASGQMPEADAAKRRITLVKLRYQTKDYAKFLSESEPLVQSGQAPADFVLLRCQSAYLLKDWDQTSSLCRVAIDSETKQGTKPQEVLYQMYVDSFAKRKDFNGYVDSLGEILAVYPKQDYWTDYLSFLRRRPGYSPAALEMDVYLLSDKLDLIKDGNEYLDLADIASKAALPAIESQAIDRATAKGLLTGNPDAKRMKDEAARGIADDQKNIDKSVAETLAKAKNGEPLAKLADAFASYGKYAKAIELYNTSLSKGGLKSPDVVKLHLALAQVNSGDKDQGLQGLDALLSAPGGVGDIARGWKLYLTQPQG